MSKSTKVSSLLRSFSSVLVLIAIIGLPAKADIDVFSLSESSNEVPLDVRFVLSVTSAAPGGTYAAAAVINVDSGWHINSNKPLDEWLIPAELILDTLVAATPHSVVYPEGKNIQLSGMLMSLYEGKTIIRFAVTVDPSAKAGMYRLPAKLLFQPCNDKECIAPGELSGFVNIEVGKEGSLQNPDIFSSTTPLPPHVDQAEEPDLSSSVTTGGELQELIDKYGNWGYLLALGLAFLTGLLLSFSPCTYPMVPITVSVFAGQQRTLWRGFVLSLIYVVSMALMYGIMGLIVALVGGVFGAWLASTAVVIGISIVFVVFAMSMFGLYELQVPASLRNRLGSTKGGGGVVGSMILGVVAALVVSPCVGPFVAGILLYVATNGSPILGFLILFVFAMGLGTLYVLIGTFSSVINALPNSGAWMETVKKFFGFVLLLMAVYFLRALISTELTAVLTGFILLILGVFGGGLDRLTPDSGFFDRLRKIVGIVAFLLSVYLLGGSVLQSGFILPSASSWLPTGGGVSTAEKISINWLTDLESGLAKAKASGKPVLVDTWATWCANCKVLEKTTFSDSRIIEESKQFVPLKLQLEKADSPETKAFMKRFGLKHYSLPTTLLLAPSGKVLGLFQGVIGPDELLAEMRKVRSSSTN